MQSLFAKVCTGGNRWNLLERTGRWSSPILTTATKQKDTQPSSNGAAKACSWVPKMTRARGQPPRTLLDREYPHQILVLAENVRGKTLDKVSDFHAKLGITRESRAVAQR
jgi:hypothetical protein